MRKITTQLCGTNICTCSARFAQSFVRQPNGPQCSQIEQNAPKLQFRVQYGGSGAFVAKNSDATSCTNFCTSSARFASSFIMQPNGPQCTQIEQTRQTISLGSTGMDRVRSLRKIPMRLRGTKFCTSSARFAPSFVRQPNGPECRQMVRNAPNHQFGVK